MKSIYLTLFLSFSLVSALCQESYFDSWKGAVQWDGVTHWSRYMRTAAGYMGPNALPVPFSGEGSIDSVSSFSASASRHVMKGDRTSNLTLYFNHVIVKDLISIDAFVVAREWYSMTREMKIERRVPAHFYDAHVAKGDVHGNFNFQILNKHRDKLHLVFRLGMRFPTSNKMGAARFTDMPGYYFDLAAGKPLTNGWKLFGNVGMYIWETIDRKLNRQDDAFLFGAGISYHTRKIHWQTAINGYLGYMENTRDKPIVIRTTLSRKWERYRTFVRFQQGLHHFKYTSLEIGAGYIFKWKAFGTDEYPTRNR